MSDSKPMTKERRDTLRAECDALTQDGGDGNPSNALASELLWLLDQYEGMAKLQSVRCFEHPEACCAEWCGRCQAQIEAERNLYGEPPTE